MRPNTTDALKAVNMLAQLVKRRKKIMQGKNSLVAENCVMFEKGFRPEALSQIQTVG